MTATVLQLPAAQQSAQSAATHQLEKAAIGGLLDLPNTLELLDGCGLAREHFEHDRIGWALEVIRRLAEKRHEVSVLAVVTHGKTLGRLDERDLPWLTDARGANGFTREGFFEHCTELRVQARARDTRKRFVEQVQLIDSGRFNPSHCSGVMDSISLSLSREFVPDQTAEADLLELNASWDEHARAGTSELDPTGIKFLDQALGGGAPQKQWFIAGAPGSGKTGLAASIIEAQLALEPVPVLDDEGLDLRSTTGVFGLEDGTDWLERRWLARDVGIKLNEVGWLKLTEEQELKRAEANARLHPLTQRIRTYNRSEITPRNLIRMLTDWICRPLPGFKKGITRAFIDHLGELDYTDERAVTEYWRQVGETVRLTRNLANRFKVPICFLVHDTDDEANKPGAKEGPPNPSKLAGGRSIDRKARAILGMWNKGGAYGSWRGTILKNTQGGPRGLTVEFERFYDAALVDPLRGRMVDLKNEADDEKKKHQAVKEDAEREKRKKQDEERRTKRRAEREEKLRHDAEVKAKLEEEKLEKKRAAPPPPQLALLPEPQA